MNWIDIKLELPKKGERVLLYDASGFGVVTGRMASLSVGFYLEGEYDANCNITHWIPLPNPPKDIQERLLEEFNTKYIPLKD